MFVNASNLTGMKKQWVQKIAWIMDSSLSQGELQCKIAYEKKKK